MNFVKQIKRIGHDIHIGQNIEIYLGVLISATIAVLSAFNITNQTITLSVLLGAMALVTSSMLVNRRQNEEIKDVLSNLKDTRSLAARFFHKEDDIKEIEQIIRNSQQVVLWGYTLTSHIPYLREVIWERVERGLQLRILLIDPSGKALEMAAFRSSGENQELKDELKKA